MKQLLDYVAEQATVETAEAVLIKVNKKCQRLAIFPNSGQRRDELSYGVRSVPVDNYLIFYRPTSSGADILRIVSGYRDLNKLFDDT